MSTPPDLFTFLDFREYLRAWVEHRRSVDPDFSFTTFAADSGLSRSTLPNVLRGARAPSPATLDGIGRALELTPAQRNYLGLLVELEKAPSVAARRDVMDRILAREQYGQYKAMESLDDGLIELSSSWFTHAVLELARTPGFRADPAWLAQTVWPPITEEQAQHALDTVVGLGLVTLDEEGGGELAVMRLATQPTTQVEASYAFFEQCLPDVLRHIRQIDPEHRHLAGGSFLIPSRLLPEAKEIVANAYLQLARLADEHSGEGPQRVYLGVGQLLPITREVD